MELQASDATAPVQITRYGPRGSEPRRDVVVREVRFELVLNARSLVALVCLPAELDAFVVGFLVNEGILSPCRALEVRITRENGRVEARGPFDEAAMDAFGARRTLTSGCGGGVTAGPPGGDGPGPPRTASLRVRPETIFLFLEVLREEASVYRATGGAHIAALADREGRLLATAQDIGRHTAVDKVIGKGLLGGIPLEQCLLFCSGRLSSEITSKAIRARTPVLVSRGAPTDLSVGLARRFGLTLVGFARGKRMNVYSVPERIVA